MKVTFLLRYLEGIKGVYGDIDIVNVQGFNLALINNKRVGVADTRQLYEHLEIIDNEV